MKQGYGSPYIKAFTSLGEITERVVDFSYKFSQKGDDVCQLRVESDDQLLPDFPIYQEGVEYTMIWGYIAETEKQKRTVVLRNIKVSYTEEGIALDLLFTDKASLIKTNSSHRVYNKKTVKEINEDVGRRNGLATDYLWEYKAGGGLLAASSPAPTPAPFNPDIRKYDTMPQANRSDYEVLKDAADNDPSGPYEIVGRDNKLVVQKPNFKQTPLRTYKWKGEDGHLLRFIPESKEYFIGSGHLGIASTSVNPRTKTFYHSLVTEGNNGLDTKLNTQISSPNYDNSNDGSGTTSGTNDASTPTKKPTPVTNDPSVKGKELETVANNKSGDKSANPLKDIGFDNVKKDSFAGRQFQFTDFSSADPNFNSAKLMSATTALPTAVPYVPTFLTGQHTPSIEDDHKKASGKAASVQHKKSLNKNPATAKIVGNVILESGKVITIEGVAKKFTGNYYIQECTHRMNPGSEYYCDLEFVRNAVGRVSKPAANTTDAANKYSKLGSKIEVNKEKGPEENKPKTKKVEQHPADKPKRTPINNSGASNTILP